IAASRAGTLLANLGTMTKCTHCGDAAAAGLDAALLAARGLTANPNVIEAANGLAEAFFDDDWEPTALTITDTPLRILDPGYALKLFPSQYATHFVIRAALDVRDRIVALEQGIAPLDMISSVEIIGPVMPYVDRPEPSSGLDGKFSFQYAAASALLDGTVGIDTFTDKQCARPEIRATLSRIVFTQSHEIPPTLDHMWVEMKVRLSDGTSVAGHCARPRGAWGAPILEAEHLIKVRDCLRRALSESHMEQVIAATREFDHFHAGDICNLMRILGGFE
ncbi:MAG TPA: MmgE/PrpD family protein, partial [Candidatus Binataceae bacterium]|nr:MmgE/PrpD family protein [Candidatus Binataceae bacterium]